MRFPLVIFVCAAWCASASLFAAESPASAPAVKPVLFNTAFESGSIGLIEKLSETEFRLHIKGQQDARGRNRQATWFFVRLDDVGGRELTIRLTDFKGEYNDRPANSPSGAGDADRLFSALVRLSKIELCTVSPCNNAVPKIPPLVSSVI